MKRTEIAMIILVASLTMIFTFTIAQSLLGNKIKRKVSVEQTQVISNKIVPPAKRTFNSDSINPTVEVCVESSTSDAPEENKSSDCSMTTPALESSEADTQNQNTSNNSSNSSTAAQTDQSTATNNKTN